MNLAPHTNLPFPTGDNLYPVNYYGPTKSDKPVVHHLPLFGDGHGPSFKDVLDIINPLQHIPIISTIYQDLTGDVPGAVARVAGGALYGGPIGAIGAFVNAAIDDSTGKTIGGYVVSAVEDLFSGSAAGDTGGKTELASAKSAKPAANSNNAAKPVAVAAAKAPVQIASAAATPAANGLVVAEAPPSAPVHRPMVTSTPLAPPDDGMPDHHAAIKAAAVNITPTKIAAAKSAPDLHTLATTNDRMMPLRGKEHFMPVPARHHFDPVQPPMIAVPLSTNGEQSNVPIVGQYHAPAYVPPARTAEPIPASVTPATDSQAQPVATAAVSRDMAKVKKGEAGTWFTSAMMQNLRKYQKMNELTKHPASAPSNT